MQSWFAALVTLGFAACAPTADVTPDAPLPLDPTGNWTVTYAFAPACGNAASTTAGTFAVTVGANGYDIEVAGVRSTGILACNATSCRLSGTWAWTTTDTGYQQSMNLTLDAGNQVTGNGTEAVVTATSNCTYPFTVTGSRT